MFSMQKRSCGGFTLIELIGVIAILAILFALGSKGIRSARLSAKKAKARMEIASIETAIKSYQLKYGKLPAASLVEHGVEDLLFDPAASTDADAENSRAIIAVLSYDESADPADNPVEMVFLDPQNASASGGSFLDPWGQQYLIALDTDYDGQLELAGQTLRAKAAIASIGLYAMDDYADTNALVASWTE